MDIKKALSDINSLEAEKARLEAELKYIEERTASAAAKMADLGVDSTTIYSEIKKLEDSITARLEAAKDAAQPKSKQSVAAASEKVESWME